MFLIWFTIYGVRDLVKTREEKFRKWYEVEGKKLEKARREKEKLEKAEKTTTKVRKAMFKMVSVMTMGSISGVANGSDKEAPQSPLADLNKKSSISSSISQSLLKS